MTAELATTITAEMTAVESTLNELLSLLRDASKSAPEFVSCFIGALDAGAELFTLESDRRAAIAGKISVVAKPSDGLAMVLAALRAGNFDLSVIEQAFGHGQNPSVGSLTVPTADESPDSRKRSGGSTPSNSGDIK